MYIFFLFPYTTKRHWHAIVCVRRKYWSHIATVNIEHNHNSKFIYESFLCGWVFSVLMLLSNILNGTANLQSNGLDLIRSFMISSNWKEILQMCWLECKCRFFENFNQESIFGKTNKLRCSNRQMSTVTLTSESSNYNKNKYGRLTEESAQFIDSFIHIHSIRDFHLKCPSINFIIRINCAKSIRCFSSCISNKNPFLLFRQANPIRKF